MVLFRLGDWGATLETVRASIDAQDTEEHTRKKGKALEQAPFARPYPGSRREWGMRSHLLRLLPKKSKLVQNGLVIDFKKT